MSNKRVLTIQDISCVGQCSITVALPIISACGIETAILPSAVLSNHTGGFKSWTFRDLTEDMPKIEQKWIEEGIQFDAIYTGYLGSAHQIDYVKHIFETCGKPGCLRIVDPAMADFGKLYAGFDLEFAKAMGRLCEAADYILPNITEASLITGMEYKESYDHDYVAEMEQRLAALGPKTVILTGISYEPSTTGVVVYENGEEKYYKHHRLPKGSHGTGDVYASSFTGALMRGFSSYDAARIAADYTVRCIEHTQTDPDHWYGVSFEAVLPELMKALES
jgi:pyridoxine kinase